MDNVMKLSIVTPSGEIYCDNIKSVVLPGKDGEFGVIPEHSSLVSALTVGVIEITNTDDSINAIAINWGHVKVNETSVDVLVDSAVLINGDDDSVIAKNIEEATKLVQSVQDNNVSIAAIESRISSFG